MASPGDYSSPSAARAARRGGRGFYRDRDLPYQERSGPRHESRDRDRNPDQREAAAAGRELSELAERYPRFRDGIYRLRNHVLLQARSENWKRQAVLDRLGPEPLSVEEIVEETGMDQQSVGQLLAALEKDGEAAKCNRNGGPVVIRSDGKPSEKVYWRRSAAGVRGEKGKG